MSFRSLKSELPRVILMICATLCSTGMALAQVETIEPNPTQPYDIDTDFGYGPTNGGARIGRGPPVPGQAREENPAETMLREIEGSNYGHYTGRAIAGYRTGAAPIGGRPENRWRYRYHRGRWWYRLSDGGWSYFDGRRWRHYSSR
ncbi:MAG: hypothetical protein ACREHD_30235 [Pirellulales bacterium]